MIRICGLLVAAAISLAPLQQGEAAPAVHRVVIAKMAFGPSPAGLKSGDTVEWVNDDIFVHSATAADGSFDVDIQPHATARVVIRNAGEIRYRCKYHPGMQGVLVVASQ